MIKKVKLNLITGTYTVIRTEGSVIITRRKSPMMSDFIKAAGIPDREGDFLVYRIKEGTQET